MSGQLFAKSEEGGYHYSAELSKYIRTALQPSTRMRQFADADDASTFGMHRGTKYFWNITTDLDNYGGELDESKPMPETGYEIAQSFLTVKEWGVAVPFTEKLDVVGKQRVQNVIDKTLRIAARKVIDNAVYNQFNQTPLRIAPTGGNDDDALTLTEDGSCTITNNSPITKKHIQRIVTLMAERSIPGFAGDAYVCLTNPGNIDPLRTELESLFQHTETGLTRIFHGEIGVYREMRFVQQTFIPRGGAQDSNTFNPLKNKGDPWNNAKSSWAFFFGSDTVMEGLITPEQIRAQIGQDYGRQRGIAWYGLFGFGIARPTAKDATIIKWDSAS